jgi:hypothetical protein
VDSGEIGLCCGLRVLRRESRLHGPRLCRCRWSAGRKSARRGLTGHAVLHIRLYVTYSMQYLALSDKPIRWHGAVRRVS